MNRVILVIVLTVISFNVSTAYNDTRGGRLLIIKLKLIIVLFKKKMTNISLFSVDVNETFTFFLRHL